MTVFEVPADVPHTSRFRVISAVVILLLLGILLFSIYVPIELSYGIRKLFAWATGAIVLVAVIVSYVLSAKLGLWNVKRKYGVELTQGKLIQRLTGSETVEIPLNQIESLHEGHGWLIVKGYAQKGQIRIPKEVNDFNSLREELTACGTIVPTRARMSLFSAMLIVLGVVLFVFFITSHERGWVVFSGVGLLVFQGFANYSLLHLLRNRAAFKVIVFSLTVEWLLIAWIIFERVKTVL
jgi:hypothetical protein